MRRAIAADDDLFLGIVESVERMEELTLRALLPGDELHVVDEQHVDGSITLPEIDDPIVAHSVDHLVHESLGRDVGELEVAIVPQHVMTDSMHQVRLAETDAAVDEERI